MKASEQLLDRLKLEGIVPHDARCTLQELHPTPRQCAGGAWMWLARWMTGGAVPGVAGSQFPVKLCAGSDTWLVSQTWMESEGLRAYVIFPMNDEDVRSR